MGVHYFNSPSVGQMQNSFEDLIGGLGNKVNKYEVVKDVRGRVSEFVGFCDSFSFFLLC